MFGARNDGLHAWLQHAAWEQAVPVTTPAQALAAGLQGRTVGEQRGVRLGKQLGGNMMASSDAAACGNGRCGGEGQLLQFGPRRRASGRWQPWWRCALCEGARNLS